MFRIMRFAQQQIAALPFGTMPVLLCTMGAQALLLLGTPLLTRLYTPAEYGGFAIFLSLTGVLGVASCLRLEQAVMLPRSPRRLRGLTAASSVLCLAVACLVLAGVALLTVAAEWRTWFWLLPAGVLLRGLTQLLQVMANRRRLVRLMGISRMGMAVATLGSQAVLALTGLGAMGLAGGYVAGQALGVGVLCLGVGGELIRALAASNRLGMLAAVRRYRRFALLEAPGALLNAAAVEIPVILAAAFFGDSQAGQYALAARASTFPAGLLSMSAGQMFYREAVADVRRMGRIGQPLFRMVRFSLVVGVPGYLLLALLAPWLFGPVFGAEWTEAGRVTAVLAPACLLMFVAGPVSTSFAAFERQDLLLRYHGAAVLVALVGFGAGQYMGGLLWATALFSAFQAMRYAAMLVSIRSLNRTGANEERKVG
ncbi:lipopolysaccharide biosynthesis protein [Desulfohalovibrio reitneri]|uniref:lipopolysaccharide biosynthesis protein n=1 Tax=Desulfohalovibrio reitneri TaxID=1307759 RepID=UPI0004A6B58C|nr:oligosaccharide flippase family protein [Desulfohalovibrio reitneri]